MNRRNQKQHSPVAQTVPELAQKCFSLEKQNMSLYIRIVELEELILQTRFFVQQGQNFVAALASLLQVDPDRFAEAIIEANGNEKLYENKLSEALLKMKAGKEGSQVQDIKDIV